MIYGSTGGVAFGSGAARRPDGAPEAAVGLASILAFSRRVASVDVDEIRNLRD